MRRRSPTLVDDLRRIQVKVAQGDKAAYPAELNQLKTIGAAIATASPETWKSKREADSLVIYILSGGSLADVGPLLKGDALIESERSLARGALAYVTNHEADAIALLKETDLTALDARLAGEVAFARSVLETKRDAKAAVDLLDWARLLAPGGLVEEAALRREIALLAEAKDMSRLAVLTRQYVTRFGASLYAADFLRDLAGAVARLGLADDPANYKLLSSAAGGVASRRPAGVPAQLGQVRSWSARASPPPLRRRQRPSKARRPTARRRCAPVSIWRPVDCSPTLTMRRSPICGLFTAAKLDRATRACWLRLEGWRRSSGSFPTTTSSIRKTPSLCPTPTRVSPAGPR